MLRTDEKLYAYHSEQDKMDILLVNSRNLIKDSFLS